MRKTEICQRDEFDVEIVIHEYEEALFSAILEERDDSEAPNSHHLALWTDGSKRGFGSDSQMGAAVVYQRYRGERLWVKNAWNIQGDLNTNEIELFAIGEALEIALSETCSLIHSNETRKGATTTPGITVFTDSQAALNFIGSFRRPLDQERMDLAISKIINMIESLKDMTVHVRLQWVPSHSGIWGNELADSLAKSAARYYMVTKTKPPHLVESSFQVRHVYNEEIRQLPGRWGDSRRVGTHGMRGRGFGKKREFQLVEIDDEERNKQS
jgi:ribonuclease HI